MSIYLDYAAATPLDSRVKREILTALDVYGNPSSVHEYGRAAKEVLNDARKRIGAILECRPEELIFAGSGTEANNLAIFGIGDGHIVSTNIEHHSVLRPLERRGNVTFVPVQKNGLVDPVDIAKAIRPDTVLVSVIYANNEIGTVQPIRKIGLEIRNSKLELDGKVPLFHVDACQAAGFLDINVQNLGVDLLTINGSKIYGPKGTGALFVRRGIRLAPLILGGDQERGLRAGTENPALFAGMAEALEIADAERVDESARLSELRDWLIEEVIKIPGTMLNGDPTQRLPNNINISFEGVDGEMLMLALDLQGIAVSTGAACTVTSNEPSHVLLALSPPDPLLPIRGGAAAGAIGGNIRITLGRQTTKKELSKLMTILPKEITRLRNL